MLTISYGSLCQWMHPNPAAVELKNSSYQHAIFTLSITYAKLTVQVIFQLIIYDHSGLLLLERFRGRCKVARTFSPRTAWLGGVAD